MSRRLKFCITALIIAVMALFLMDSAIYISAFNLGLTAWATSVLPALLPFMIWGRLLAKFNSNITTRRSLTTMLFNAPRGCGNIVLLSLLCGYPMGAKLIVTSYEEGKYSATNCRKILSIACSCGPVFIVATVGEILLDSTIAGVIILASHLLGMFGCALMGRSSNVDNAHIYKPTSITKSSDVMIDSLLAVMCVGGYIALFFVIAAMLEYLLPSWFAGQGQLVTGYIVGILEMSSGCIYISKCTNLFTATVLCCSIVSFGGICVLLQCMTFLSQCKVKFSQLIKQKIVHCAFSTIICYVLASLLIR